MSLKVIGRRINNNEPQAAYSKKNESSYNIIFTLRACALESAFAGHPAFAGSLMHKHYLKSAIRKSTTRNNTNIERRNTYEVKIDTDRWNAGLR